MAGMIYKSKTFDKIAEVFPEMTMEEFNNAISTFDNIVSFSEVLNESGIAKRELTTLKDVAKLSEEFIQKWRINKGK